jgi:hypothetical protein
MTSPDETTRERILGMIALSGPLSTATLARRIAGTTGIRQQVLRLVRSGVLCADERGWAPRYDLGPRCPRWARLLRDLWAYAELTRLCYTDHSVNATAEVGMPDVPEELLHQRYPCPDCAAETGGDGLRPGTEFSWVAAKGYKGGVRRVAYCKRHASRRASESRKKRLAAEPKDGQVWAAKRATDRALRERNLDERRAQERAAAQRYRQRHPERARLSVLAWAARHPETRKQSQDAYRERRKLRGVRPVRQKQRPETPEE